MPNPAHALDAAMSFSLHVGRHWRGASDVHRWASKCQFTIDTIQALKLVGWRVRQNYPSSIPVAIYCDESRVSGAGGLPGRRGAAEALGDAGSGSKSKVQGPKSKVQGLK